MKDNAPMVVLGLLTMIFLGLIYHNSHSEPAPQKKPWEMNYNQKHPDFTPEEVQAFVEEGLAAMEELGKIPGGPFYPEPKPEPLVECVGIYDTEWGKGPKKDVRIEIFKHTVVFHGRQGLVTFNVKPPLVTGIEKIWFLPTNRYERIGRMHLSVDQLNGRFTIRDFGSGNMGEGQCRW